MNIDVSQIMEWEILCLNRHILTYFVSSEYFLDFEPGGGGGGGEGDSNIKKGRGARRLA